MSIPGGQPTWWPRPGVAVAVIQGEPLHAEMLIARPAGCRDGHLRPRRTGDLSVWLVPPDVGQPTSGSA